MHAMNPEIEEFGMGVMMTYYITVAIVLGIITLLDDGLELAIGLHVAVNVFGALIITYRGSAIQTDALFRTSAVYPVLMIVMFLLGIGYFLCYGTQKSMVGTIGRKSWATFHMNLPLFPTRFKTSTRQMKRDWLTSVLLLAVWTVSAQNGYWQQRADYNMVIEMNTNKHQYKGKQKLVYHNNSPDTITKVFYHLYYNAFQPGSMMDVRSNSIADPDPRVTDRITHLSENEMGFQRIKSLKQDGHKVEYFVVGTILEVALHRPVLPHERTTLTMDFRAQIPIQIRRTGRDNAEGIAYSMSQWFPKLCEYDHRGWHANPYVGREFHGVWGDYDVTIEIDREFIVAATGVLQNAHEIGYGYSDKIKEPAGRKKKTKWRFIAENVHDFAWAADPDFVHETFQRDDGMVLHFFFQLNERTEKWYRLPEVMDKAFDFVNERYGQYPYPQYSFIQGGDGGMEYPMVTLVTGERSFPSLVSVCVHELLHSWYQGVLATNESLFAWMDEGFTTYTQSKVLNYLRAEGTFAGQKAADFPHDKAYQGYVNFAKTGLEEPLSIHADHFVTNTAYGMAVYTKGQLYLVQLSYILGQDAFDQAFRKYYDSWKFKHPEAHDFIRILEKHSGIELDWYHDYWINTVHTVDYAIDTVFAEKRKKTKIALRKIGIMPMPLDVTVKLKDGSRFIYNIPLRMMRGEKEREDFTAEFSVAEDWPWTHERYDLIVPHKHSAIESVEIDETRRLMDVDRANNRYPVDAEVE